MKKLFILLGSEIQYSKSPSIYNGWFQRDNIFAHYTLLDMPKNSLPAAVRRILQEPNIRGGNITTPFKAGFADYCDSLSNEAKEIGAVNTFIKRDDNTITGYNTDALALLHFFQQPEIQHYSAFPVIVFGTGGAAKASIWALSKIGIHKIEIVSAYKNRAIEFAKQIEKQFSIHVVHTHTYKNVIDNPQLNTKLILLANKTPVSFSQSFSQPQYIINWNYQFDIFQHNEVINGKMLLEKQAELSYRIFKEQIFHCET